MPAAPAGHSQVRLLSDFCDTLFTESIATLTKELVYKTDPTMRNKRLIAEATEKLLHGFASLQPCLAGQSYLLGHFSLADIVFAPFVLKLAGLVWPELSLPEEIQAWISRLETWPSIGPQMA